MKLFLKVGLGLIGESPGNSKCLVYFNYSMQFIVSNKHQKLAQIMSAHYLIF